MFLMSLEINRSGWRLNPLINDIDESNDEYNFQLEEVENVEDLFPEICDQLENSNLVKFRVEGFGELPLPVDVSTDLMIVIEQLSDFLKFLDTWKASTGYLKFYEQGIERQRIFTKVGNLVKINCHPLLAINESAKENQPAWGQNIAEEPLDKKSLKIMIGNLILTFVSIASELCPTLTNHKCFQEWCSDKYIANALKERFLTEN